MPGTHLSDDDVERFEHDGFVRLEAAIPRATALACRDALWPMVEAQVPGLRRDEPATWTKPVVRVVDLPVPAFRAASGAPAIARATDRLVGEGRWVPRVDGRFGGTVPVRFPHPDDPGDAGWHIDGSYVGPDGAYWANHRSKGRALLLLVLLSDVGTDDAPTRLRPGSHRAVAPHLEPHGEAGVSFLHAVPPACAGEPAPDELALATGSAGDVYVCHPFLVHAADKHRGRTPRFVAQAAVEPADAWDLTRPVTQQSPVERAAGSGHQR